MAHSHLEAGRGGFIEMPAEPSKIIFVSEMVLDGIFGVFSVFGTASTGTALSTLSGAVATKETLAAIGGDFWL